MNRRSVATSASLGITISHVLVAEVNGQSMKIPLSITQRKKTVEPKALIDSGAGGVFMDVNYVKKQGLITTKMIKPLPVYNVDGTPNARGPITECVWAMTKLGSKSHLVKYFVTALGDQDVILGLSWLRQYNPLVNWKKGTVEFSETEPHAFTKLLRRLLHIEPISNRKVTIEDVEEEPEQQESPHDPTVLIEEVEMESEAIEEAVLPEIEEEAEHSAEDHIQFLGSDEFLLSYTPGENICRVWTHEDEPLTQEFDYSEGTRYGPRIGRITRTAHGTRYTYGCDAWIRAKVNPAMAMAQQASKDDVPKTLDELIPKSYHDFLDVFEKKKAERFPESRPYDHAINLKPEFVPKNFKIYPLSPVEQQKLDEFLEENLRKGYIRPSQSPMASPFFFVGKKDGSLRPCQDYRYLNEGTIKDSYPLPLISELLDKLNGATIFSKLDLRSGYNNVRIKDGDQWKAAFKTNRGLFEPTVMFFGLCNSPATFQHMMNDLFRDMLDEGWLVIYMDDMLVFSKDKKTHAERVRRILQRLRENDLFLKAEKCIFDAEEVEFLGLIVKPGELHMDPVKLDGIRNWPQPETVKQVRSFLGFGNFYRKFIRHYAELARPLHDLTKKDVPWNWSSECQHAFDSLKERFTSAPVLRIPDPTKPFVLETDASKFATGAVLRQQDMNGDWHPCGFLSQSFSPAEKNYQIYDKELLGIINGLKAWRHYFEGSSHKLVICTDHRNLTYYRLPQQLTERQRRWQLFLSRFNYSLLHVPGSQMTVSDNLSRNPTMDDKSQDDKLDVMIPDHLFVRTVNFELREKIVQSTALDPIAKDAVEAITGDGISRMKQDLKDWEVIDGIIRFKGRIYVPQDDDLRRQIVREHHDLPVMGHPGNMKTKDLVSRDYWWPGLHSFVTSYVQGCSICQQTKINTHPTVPPIQPIPSKSNRPFADCSVDFITDLPLSGEFDSIMVVVDHGLSKGVIFTPCTKKIDAIGTASLIHQHVYKRFGLMDSLISDRGPQFASHAFQELLRIIGTKSKLSTAYHPQTDGETERANQELEGYLRIFCGNNPDEWSHKLADAEFVHNSRIHESRGMSPFYIMMGYNPKVIPIAYPRTNVPAVQERIQNLQKIWEEARAAHELAMRKVAARATKKFTPFKEGDKVWLEGKNLKLGYEHRKLKPLREGPFVIKDVLGPLTYRLKLPKHWKIHDVFHASLLVPYRETEAHGPNFLAPPPELVEGEEEFEVEAILAHRKVGGHLKYLVKWKGYPTSENTLEPESNLTHSKEILAAYKKRRKLD